jgi:hypothetical protein
MSKHLKSIVATILLLTTISYGRAQSIEIDFIELSGRNIIVHYNLDDGANSNRQFMVQLYSSQDNFAVPLTRVSGDVGTEVLSGIDKKITWDITQELGAFKGDVSLELRGRVYVPFVKIQKLEKDKIFKRGKNYPLSWTSGNLSGQVNIELFNDDGERIWGENNVSNVGKFDWYIPAGIRKGNNYTLKFTNAKDRNDIVVSNPFTIKPKIPLLIKVGTVAVLAAGVQLLLMNSKSDSNSASPFPDPTGPPTN